MSKAEFIAAAKQIIHDYAGWIVALVLVHGCMSGSS